jgi:serine/threonine-protein kinase
MLGPYEILAPIGAGGMGEVFRARDPRVGRDVAIKVSADRFSDRFAREARAIAALNHPNICTLYDVGPNYLVMELIEGESLRARMRSGALAESEALRIAGQVADALESAHDNGVVHRDLKPANIMIRPDGTVKVLDFGLAKMAQASAGPADDTPTRSVSLTEGGAVMGTAAYMSPEQARGSEVDKRTDIWAFGVVLYEMLTGDRLFTGASLSDVLAAVLTRDLDLSTAPPAARRLLTRCLERDPRRRLRDIGDARILLDQSPVLNPAAPSALRWLPWAAAAALAIALAVALVLLWREPGRGALSTMRLNVDLGPQAVGTAMPALSPDGQRLVFVARAADGHTHLLLRRLDTAQDEVLPGTEEAASPFFSADGRWIAFFAAGQLRRISVQGGAVVKVADISGPNGASWGEDGTIVVGSGNAGGLSRVSWTGGTPEPLTRTGEHGDATHRYPQVLPGAKAALFTSHKIVTGFDDATIEAVSLATGERKVVLRGGYFARYISDVSALVYLHDGVLFAVPFDVRALEVRGTPVPVLEEVAGDANTGAGNVDVAGGTLIYRQGKGPVRTWQVLALDRLGRTEPLIADAGTYYTPAFSPNGDRLALAVDYGDRGREIAVYDVQRASLQRLTFTKEVNLFPVWSPDGRYLAFESSSPTGYGLGLIRADGGGALFRTLEHPGLMVPGSFSRDGHTLAYNDSQTETGFDIWTVTVGWSDPERPTFERPTPFQRTPFSEHSPVFSPDGRWIAYVSNESGRGEIYVRPFPGPGGKSRVSLNGGYNPVWSPAGRELYFWAPDARIMVTSCRVQQEAFVVDQPRLWADTQLGLTFFARDMSLSPRDGRFAVLSRVAAPTEAGPAHLAFVLNFLEDIRRRVK